MNLCVCVCARACIPLHVSDVPLQLSVSCVMQLPVSCVYASIPLHISAIIGVCLGLRVMFVPLICNCGVKCCKMQLVQVLFLVFHLNR